MGEDVDNKRHFYQCNNSLEILHSKNYVNETPIGFQVINNGFILPLKRETTVTFLGGVVDSSKKFVAGLMRHHDKPNWNPNCIKSYEFDDFLTSDDSVIFGGVIIPQFGHFLIDSLSRIWFVVKNKDALQKYKIIFTLVGSTIPSYIYETLELLGIKQEQVVFIKTVTKFKEIIIPDQSGYTGHYIHKEFLTIYEEMLSNSLKVFKGETYKKIFLSRAKCKTGYKLIGEEFFSEFYSNHGFKVIYTDEMSMIEKVALIGSADEIVTTCGTISLYSLFVRNDCKVTLLGRNYNDVPNCQIIVNSAKNYECYIVDCSFNFLYSDLYSGVSLLYPTKYWLEYVKDVYGIKSVPSIDSSCIFEYIKYFYQYYKEKPTFDFANEKFAKDFFERCGKLF